MNYFYTSDAERQTAEAGDHRAQSPSHAALVDYNQRLGRYAAIVQSNLARARKIQHAMLADMSDMPLGEKLCWASSYRPADQVGGDFYDARLIGPSRVAVIFGDVSGHGMAAALVTAVVKSAFQWWQPTAMPLTAFLQQLNDQLKSVLPNDNFAALTLGVVDVADGSFRYINGGHNPQPWLLPGDSQKHVRPLDGSKGALLGVLDSVSYSSAKVKLNLGDTLLFITDGITEARNVEGEMFGTAAVKGLAAGLSGRSASEIVTRLDELVESYCDGATDSDDRTILAMQLRRADTQA